MQLTDDAAIYLLGAGQVALVVLGFILAISPLMIWHHVSRMRKEQAEQARQIIAAINAGHQPVRPAPRPVAHV